MFINKFMFWFWIGMILLSIALGWANFIAGSMLTFGLNVLTVALATYNLYNMHKVLNR
jgi:hypothetical protein